MERDGLILRPLPSQNVKYCRFVYESAVRRCRLPVNFQTTANLKRKIEPEVRGIGQDAVRKEMEDRGTI